MGRPTCSGCLESKPCTGWTIDLTDDGTSYWARCDGPGIVRISTYAPDRHQRHPEGDES